MLENQADKNKKPQVKAATSTQGNARYNDNSNSTTPGEMKAREELKGGKARYEKGIELYKQGKVSIGSNGLFKVNGFEVNTGRMQCNCPDNTSRMQPCKHIFACLLFVKNRGKQNIEHLDSPGNSSTGSDSQGESNRTVEPKPKDSLNKHIEGHNRVFDRQSIITAGLFKYCC